MRSCKPKVSLNSAIMSTVPVIAAMESISVAADPPMADSDTRRQGTSMAREHEAQQIATLSEDIFARAASLRQNDQPFVLATVVWSQSPTSARPGAKGIITPDGALFGWVGGSCAQPTVVREAFNALGDGRSRLLRLDPEGTADLSRPTLIVAPLVCQSGGTIEVFLEPFLPSLQLVVFGQSPVSDALIRLGHVMGYRVIAARPGNVDSVPPEADLELDTLDITAISSGRQTVAVVASMGIYDEDAVSAALQAGVAFVSLVASRRRFESARSLLTGSGVSEELLDRVKGPAGLDISASAPEEIAISILAEIIALRSNLPLPTAAQPTSEPPAIAIDPVCGMEVEIVGARNTSEYTGQTYYFCCAGCRRSFEASPEEYRQASVPL